MKYGLWYWFGSLSEDAGQNVPMVEVNASFSSLQKTFPFLNLNIKQESWWYPRINSRLSSEREDCMNDTCEIYVLCQIFLNIRQTMTVGL
jgi:hypothetical protein